MARPTVGRIVHVLIPDEKPQAAMVIDDEVAGDQIRLQIFARTGGRFHGDFPSVEGVPNHQGYTWAWPPRD